MSPSFMEHAIILAEKGKGKVKARPLVGCLIVKEGKVIAAGFHGEKGRKHAEAIALEKASRQAKGADLHCTLEPCSHRGLTGPCAEKIIRAGAARVFIGALDANPKVRGKGIALLQKAGIEVQCGMLESKCLQLNDYFNKWIQTKTPFVVLKSALTRDGFISWGDGKRKKISGKEADKFVQDYRAECDCLLVGIGTVLKDDPRLTCRKKGARNPVRVILDSELRIPIKAKLLVEKGKTIIFHSSGADIKKRKALERKRAECISVKGKEGELDLKDVLKALGEKNYMSVLVEGGQKVNTSFLREGLVDRIVLIFSRKEVGRGLEFCNDSISRDLKIKKGSIRQLGKDVLVEGYL
ncbi:MAG: bifunctional diaminohydroxyphosphoribosylaminopyrimidine deaminase/5-amino-6-(5-phosphoribosylamino)uracil reductase RibD [Candidatus Diapherotrites archaeon]